jgi:hypothetical protein
MKNKPHHAFGPFVGVGGLIWLSSLVLSYLACVAMIIYFCQTFYSVLCHGLYYDTYYSLVGLSEIGWIHWSNIYHILFTFRMDNKPY